MKKPILIILVALLSITTFAQNSNHKNVKNNIALEGYDVVAYFKNDKAIEGKTDISTNYDGVTYQFSSKENKQLFLENPSRYLPQFGGFCAYGMSQGYEAPIKPEAFTIVDDKLYLNYNLKVKEMWLKEQQKRIEMANINWEIVSQK